MRDNESEAVLGPQQMMEKTVGCIAIAKFLMQITTPDW